MSDIAIRILAYLPFRDPTGSTVRGYVAKTRCNLLKLSHRADLEIFLALDKDPKQSDRVVFQRWHADSSVDQVCPSCDQTSASILREFVGWVKSYIKKNSPNVPTVLIMTGHGVPGYGFYFVDELRAILTKKDQDVDGRLEQLRLEAEENIDIPKDQEPVSFNDLLDRLQKELGLETKLAVSPKEYIVGYEDQKSVQEVPARRDVGVTLLNANGDGDILSVKKFRQILESENFCPDCIVLQACALGLVEIAYELRNVSKSVITCSVELLDEYNIKEPFEKFLGFRGRHVLDQKRFAHNFSRAFISSEIEFRSAAGDDINIALIASEGCQGNPDAWSTIPQTLQRLTDLLLGRSVPERKSLITAIISWFENSKNEGIRNRRLFGYQLVQCDPNAHDAVHILRLIRNFYNGVDSSVATEVQSILDEFIVSQRAVTIYEQAFSVVRCYCRTEGLCFYVPREGVRIPSDYDGESDNGFELLKQFRWHEIIADREKRDT